jgi:RNase P subunit RPR2
MTCRRCHGLMVRERYDDLELGSAGYEISGWRCLNCGAIVDASIATHHHIPRKTEPDELLKQRLKELVMAP